MTAPGETSLPSKTNGPRPIDPTELRVVTFLHGAGPQMTFTIGESLFLERHRIEYALMNLLRSGHVKLGGMGLYASTGLFDPDLDYLASERQ